MSHAAQRIAELSPRKRALLLARLKQRKGRGAGDRGAIEALPRSGGGEGDRFPVSFSQLREWILDRLEPGTSAYNVPLAVALSGRLDTLALARALSALTARHESLRTAFEPPRTDPGPVEYPGEPIQVVLPRVRPAFPVVDLARLPERLRNDRALHLERFHARIPFALDRAPLFRATLLRLGAEEHRLLLSMHHIVSDGWSLGVLFRDLGRLYRAGVSGGEAELPPLPVQYGDFADWQRRTLRGAVLEELVGFWREQLGAAPAVVELPADRPRPAVRTHRAGIVAFRVSPAVTAALHREARRQEASLFMVLLAALDVLLFRLTGEDDLPVGTYIANRNRAETAEIIGFFVNTLVLRTRLEGDPSLADVVRRVRRVTLDAYEHQDLSFEKLLDVLRPSRDPSRTPLFQVLCVLQNTPGTHVAFEGLSFRGATEPGQRANFDLSLFCVEDRGGVAGTLDYDRQLFDACTIRRWASSLSAVLEELACRPDKPLSAVSGMTYAERHQLCREWAEAGRRTPPGPDTASALVAVRARLCPEAAALESAPGRVMSYGALMDRVLELAAELRCRGAGPGAVVGVLVEAAPEAVVAFLGVLEAGAAYLPIDPGLPEERKRFLLADAGASLLLVDHGGRRAGSGTRWVELGAGQEGESGTAPRAAHPEDLAYVIYTSGSTGAPKGVEVSHRSLASYSRVAAASFQIRPDDRVLQFADLSFDASAEEIYPCLAAGATLVFREAAALPAPGELLEVASRRRLTVLDLPTAYWQRLVAALPGAGPLPDCLRLVIVGGEAARAETVAAWRRSAGDGVRLVNTYGPTEATIVSSWADLAGRPEPERVPIGRPVPGASLVPADRHLQPVPPGVQGEILIGGAGVARGYGGRPALTAERFVPDPWGSEPGMRLYRSGDIGRFGAAGELEFAGRIDHQVKVRGFRIEPGEVEAALTRIPRIRAAAVAAHDGGPAGLRLVAYVVADGEAAPPAADLRRQLAERLPPHMIPALFVSLPALPLTPQGKVDRRRLPAPGSERPEIGTPYAVPRTPAERALAALWCDLLGVERAGIHDNFFDLGGDSLLLLLAHERIAARFTGATVTVLDLFRYPTIETLAARLEPGKGERDAGGSVERRVARQREARALRQSHTARGVQDRGVRHRDAPGRRG